MQIISPSSESHQQVVAVGQPLTAQPQGTVVVRIFNLFVRSKVFRINANNNLQEKRPKLQKGLTTFLIDVGDMIANVSSRTKQ